MALPVPIGQAERRLPQAGRIRIGIKDENKRGKDKRRAIDTFRFTSQDESLLAPLAEIHGGKVTPWRDPKSGDRFELISQTRRLDVVLAPDPLTEWYELWSGQRGLERRCDGLTCEMLTTGAEGPEVRQEDCLCAAKGALACRYKLRLSVILPAVESLGVWRLDTGSENARKEVPAMVELIRSLQERGLTRAVLRLEQRTAPGKRYNVPVLDPAVSIDALGAGASRVGQLPQTTRPPAGVPELAAGEPLPPPSLTVDDEVVEGEIVPEHVDPTIGRAFLDNLTGPQRNKALTRAREISEEAGLPAPASLPAIDDRVVDQLVDEWMS